MLDASVHSFLSYRGDVLEVKVLGILAMVDDGETDWKVIGWSPKIKGYFIVTLPLYLVPFVPCIQIVR